MRSTKSLSRRFFLKLSAGALTLPTLSGCTETAETHQNWGDVTEIALKAYTDGWRGLNPAAIEGKENPELVLYEERDYQFTVQNGDGERHLLEIPDTREWSDEDQVTVIDENEEEQTIMIEVTPWMTEYICDAHRQPMHGEIEVQLESDTSINGPDE